MSGSLFDARYGLAEGLLAPGNINLSRRPRVRNADGSTSTIRSMSFEDDNGHNVLIPTVIEGRGIVPAEEAIKHYYQTGEHLGVFDSPKSADAYAESLHKQQAKQYGLDSGDDFVSQLVELLSGGAGR